MVKIRSKKNKINTQKKTKKNNKCEFTIPNTKISSSMCHIKVYTDKNELKDFISFYNENK